MLIFGQKITV